MSRNATTVSSSYTMSAGLSRATMRQNTQSFTGPPSAPAIIAEPQLVNRRRSPHGNVSQMQTPDPQERQSREARLHVVPQDVPGPRSQVQEHDLTPHRARRA